MEISRLRLVLSLCVGIALAAAGSIFISWDDLHRGGDQLLGDLLALGLIPQLVGHSTLNWALHYLSATYVSIVTLVEPIGSGILAYLVLGEAVSVSTAVGAVPVLAGIYIASRAEMASMVRARAGQAWRDCAAAYSLVRGRRTLEGPPLSRSSPATVAGGGVGG